MDAHIGDRIIVESEKVVVATRQGEILEVIPHESHTEFRVRWDNGHVSEIRPIAASYRIVSAARLAPG